MVDGKVTGTTPRPSLFSPPFLFLGQKSKLTCPSLSSSLSPVAPVARRRCARHRRSAPLLRGRRAAEWQSTMTGEARESAPAPPEAPSRRAWRRRRLAMMAPHADEHGVTPAGEDLGDAAAVVLPQGCACDGSGGRGDLGVVGCGEAAEEERRRAGARGEPAEERHGGAGWRMARTRWERSTLTALGEVAEVAWW
uniref:DUF834 domain-containing protein n=1 Tax=Setaria viridis TaxID=4556 RepID=A0A4U6U0N7_SETVI|nr:hypothetical protein SEVIR_6G062800v2 [Setaria viridis]